MKTIYPFAIYNEWLKLSMKTAQMMMSSGEVIMYRTDMMSQAMQGKLLWTNPEFSKLWQEKIAAAMESSQMMANNFWKQSLSNSKTTPEQQLTQGLKAISDSVTPYEKKATANAKRLRSK